jgi:hypothetical protein
VAGCAEAATSNEAAGGRLAECSFELSEFRSELRLSSCRATQKIRVGNKVFFAFLSHDDENIPTEANLVALC